MKRRLLLFCTIFLSIFVLGQSAVQNTKSGSDKKRHSLEGSHYIFSKSDKNEKQNYRKLNSLYAKQIKSVYAFKQKLDSITSESWDATSSQWGNYDKDVYTYDANGNNTLDIYSVWDDVTSRWVGAYKDVMTFDNLNRITEFNESEWDADVHQWVNSYKDELTYNMDGTKTVSIESDWDTDINQWYVAFKNELTYDINGNLILYIGFNWDDVLSEWAFSDKDEYNYNSKGNDTLYMEYSWDGTAKEWVKSYKTEYTYNANGNCILALSYSWLANTMEWSPSYKSDYSFNTDGNDTLNIYYHWDQTNSKWIGEEKDDLAFNNAYSYDALILPYFDSESKDIFNHMLVQLISYSYNMPNWILDYKSTIYYSATDISEISGIKTGNGINVFPNPASEFVSFSIKDANGSYSFEMFDQLGRKIMNQTIQNDFSISVQNLSKGIYMYRLHDGVKLYTGKLLIE